MLKRNNSKRSNRFAVSISLTALMVLSANNLVHASVLTTTGTIGSEAPPAQVPGLTLDPNADLPEFMEIDELEIPVGDLGSPGTGTPGGYAPYVMGYPGGKFRPDAPLTRAEAMAMLVRVQGMSEVSGQALSTLWSEPYRAQFLNFVAKEDGVKFTINPLSWSKYGELGVNASEWAFLVAQFTKTPVTNGLAIKESGNISRRRAVMILDQALNGSGLVGDLLTGPVSPLSTGQSLAFSDVDPDDEAYDALVRATLGLGSKGLSKP